MKTLLPAAKAEFINLYKLINNKDKLEKLKKAINNHPVNKKKSGLSNGIKIGIGVGVSLGVLLLLGGLGYWYTQKQKRTKITK